MKKGKENRSCLLFIATGTPYGPYETLQASTNYWGWNVLRVSVFTSPDCPAVTWTCVEPTAAVRKIEKPKHWQVILQLSSAFFRPICYVRFFPCFWDSGRVIGGVPPPLQLYSSYREDLGVFLYYYFFFSCRSVKGFKLHWQKYQNESVFFSSHLKFAGAAGRMHFWVCISW